jgi:hypothetical protein
MIETKSIEDLISISLWTGYLEDEQPQSIMIISNVEGGKSLLTSQFMGNDGVRFMHDATAYGILKAYKQDLIKGKIKHFIFPEFIFPLSRQKETVNSFLAFLNGLVEEGIKEIQTYATKIILPKPIRAGVIACLSRDEFQWRKNYWCSIGFLSRFLPVSYSYSKRVEDAIFEAIFSQESEVRDIKFKFHRGRVKLPQEMARQLKPIAKVIAQDCSRDDKTKKLAGFRAQIGLQRMVKGIALARGKSTVTQAEVDRLNELSRYLNLKFNEI